MRLPEGNKPLRRCRHPMEDDIKLDLIGVGREVLGLTDVAHDRCK